MISKHGKDILKENEEMKLRVDSLANEIKENIKSVKMEIEEREMKKTTSPSD